MPSGQEILGSLYGAWRILRMDPAALSYFNQTIDGFWRSFFAVVLVTPAFALITYAGIASLPEDLVDPDLSAGAQVFSHLVGFLVAWAVFPVAMIWISRLLNLGHRYVVYIIVWNWSNVVSAAIFLAVTLLLWSGALSTGVNSALTIFTFGYVLFYAYLVVRLGLGCAAGTAIGIVVLEVALEHVIDLVVGGALQSALS